MKRLGIAGFSGSGKTTLVTRLIPELRCRGLSVSTIKHTHHNVSVDRRGDASWELRQAGASEVAVAGNARWALLHEHHGEAESSVDDLVARMDPVDLLLIEGFKRHEHDKIEVHRPQVGKPLLAEEDAHIIAVASTAELPHLACPRLDLDDIQAIATFIIQRLAL